MIFKLLILIILTGCLSIQEQKTPEIKEELMFSSSEELNFLLAEDLLTQGKLKEAEKIYLQIFEKNPNFIVGQKLFILSLGQKQLESAIMYANKLHGMFPKRTEPILWLSDLHRLQGDSQSSFSILREGSQDDPLIVQKISEKLFENFQNYLDQGLEAKALQSLNEIEKNYLFNEQSYIMLIMGYQRLKNYSKSTQVLKEAQGIYPHSRDLEFQEIILVEFIESIDKAIEKMESFIIKYPQFGKGLNYLGYAYILKSTQLEKGYSLIQRALECEPKNPYFKDSLGWAEYHRENYKEALKIFEEALKLDSEEPIIYFHQGKTYLKLGKVDKAQIAFDKALKLIEKKSQKFLDPEVLSILDELREQLKKLQNHKSG